MPVRLNTNESPYPPPAEFVTEWLAALAAAPYNRYPDRGATELRAALAELLGQPAARIFPANGSNEVLQTILLTYGGSGPRGRSSSSRPTRCTRTSRASPRPRWSRANATSDLAIDLDSAAALDRASTGPSIVFVCSPNNPTGTVEPREVVDRARSSSSRGTAVCSSSTRPTASSRRGARSSWSTTPSRSSSCAPIRRCGRWPRCGSASRVGPEWLVAELDKVVLPYHLSVPTQLAGRLALGYRDEMERRVASLIEERGAPVRRARASSTASPCSRRAPTSCCSACTATATRCGRRCSRAACSSATSRAGPGSTSACGSPSARPPRTTRSSPRSRARSRRS